MMAQLKSVVNEFIYLSINESTELTPQKLQGLLFLSNGLNLALKNESLFEEKFEVQKNGPRLKIIYLEYLNKDHQQIKRYLEELNLDGKLVVNRLREGNEKQILKYVWKKFKYFDGIEISFFIRNGIKNWGVIYNDGKGIGKIIDNEVAKNLMKDLIKSPFKL